MDAIVSEVCLEPKPNQNFHSRAGGGGGSSPSSSGSELWIGSPMSSQNQRLRSAILHRTEQNGISGDFKSGTNGLRHVGHCRVDGWFMIVYQNSDFDQIEQQPQPLRR